VWEVLVYHFEVFGLHSSSAKAAIKTAFLKEEDDDDESALACPSPHHFFSVMCIQVNRTC